MYYELHWLTVFKESIAADSLYFTSPLVLIVDNPKFKGLHLPVPFLNNIRVSKYRWYLTLLTGPLT